MDIWANSNVQDNEKPKPGRYSSGKSRRRETDEREFANRENGSAKKEKKEKSQKPEMENRRPHPNNRNTFSREEKVRSFNSQNDERESSKVESDDEVEIEEDEESYGTMEYSEKYENKKYYGENSVDQNSRRGYRSEREEPKYNNEKSSSSSASSNSDDESTITIPETGRKVEHIAQKLEQTAQKYAREHSPPKFIERRGEYKSQDRREEKNQQQTQQKPQNNYENFNDRERRPQSQRYERDYFEKSATLVYEREKNSEKNPERNRNVERISSRRFERPRPPSVEAPERPTDQRNFRERRYSEKEEIYGETGKYIRDAPIDKDRGYESNFETKLERNKIIERHTIRDAHSPSRPNKNTLERNDTNNNTLKNERKPLLPRQSTAMGHLIQTGRVFDMEAKSPKLVKRTKSFWRFRRDSEVLEGMALWQHRSLVDIPQMIKKEAKDEKNETNESSRKSSYEGSPKTHRSLEKKNSGSTITNERCVSEPKPAERMHVPEKIDYFEDFPTPAERPKVIERSEYRPRQEERTYFVGNVSRKAILENERKRSLEAKRHLIVTELKENNEAKRNERRKKTYGDDDDGLIQNFTETEASDEESTYSCIVVKDQVTEKTLLPRTKLRRDSDRERGRNREREKNTCGPWYDLWGVDSSVNKKKKKK